MRGLKGNIKKIEEQIGANEEINHLIISVGRYQPGNNLGEVVSYENHDEESQSKVMGIWEIRGKKFIRSIPVDSEEGKHLIAKENAKSTGSNSEKK